MKRKCGDTANRLKHNTFEGLHTLQMFKKTTEKGIEKLNIFHTSPLPCNDIDHCSKSCNLRYQYPCEISTYLASSLDDMDNSMLYEFPCQSLINFHTYTKTTYSHLKTTVLVSFTLQPMPMIYNNNL